MSKYAGNPQQPYYVVSYFKLCKGIERDSLREDTEQIYLPLCKLSNAIANHISQ